jgi:hypothetical protein
VRRDPGWGRPNDTDYKGVEVSVSKRMSRRWSLLSGASFGRARTASRGGNRNDPNVLAAFDDNPLSAGDRPWSALVVSRLRAALTVLG